MELIFASANRDKLAEARKIFGPRHTLLIPADLGYTEDIPETGATLRENSIQKARFVWNLFHRPCFSDDTGLEVDALGGAPGVFSARYAGEPKSTERNIAKLLKDLEGVPAALRTARFKCVVSFICDGELSLFEGACEGSILFAPVCRDAFGYDPVFVPQGGERTMAEMSMEEKNAISHRGKAMQQLACHLSQNPRP